MRNVIDLHESGEILESDTDLTIRKASMTDIHSLLNLINGYATKGIMLPRTEFEMSENIRDFTLVFSGERLVACGALHFYSPTIGEVRSLAVHPGSEGQGIGRILVQALEQEARKFHLHTIFAFTYVDKFFARLGFTEVERGELPLKVWKDCLRCPKFQSCDEIAVVKHLIPRFGKLNNSPSEDGGNTLFPVLKP